MLNKLLKYSTLTAFTFILASTISCKKKGCTDSDSLTYDEKAKKDDGSCSYELNLSFYWNEAASSGLINDGATSISLYINGELKGSSGTDVYVSGVDECSDGVGIEATIDLGKNKTTTYTYSIKDQTGFEYWTNTSTTTNLCETIGLKW